LIARRINRSMDVTLAPPRYDRRTRRHLEMIMQPTLEIRRHGDGSIDYDFYRRRAMRRRRLARRLLAKHYLSAAGRLASASVLAMRSFSPAD
jgi:hypothetical protein